MGTSGAYGGSGRQGWRRAGELLDGIAPVPITPSGVGDQPVGDQHDDDQPLSNLWGAIADVLSEEDPLVDSGQDLEEYFSLPDLLPRRAGMHTSAGRGATSGGSLAVPVGGATRSAGRKGSHSSRNVIKGAARGGAALGGAYAVRRGDASALRDIGLDLDEMRGLSPRMQCAKILDAVLGEGGHPDEYALREAAAEQLKDILISEEPPSEIDSLRGFIANYLFKLALVELGRWLEKGAITAAEAVQKEIRIRRWAESRVKTIQLAVARTLPAARFKQVAAKLARETLQLLRAGAGD